jgi:phosphatidylinositol alpha-1,6-mannosyltransferase
MKSLLIARVFPPRTGGSGRWFWEMYRRLPAAECVIVAGKHPAAEMFDATHDLNVYRAPLDFPDYGVFSVNGYRRYLRQYHRVLEIARRERVDAIHAGAMLPEGWIAGMAARRLRLPLLVYLHGEEICYAKASRQLAWMGRRVMQDAARVVVNSRNSLALAREYWGVREARIRVLHPGVECGKFTPAVRDLEVRRALGWAERPVVLTVGRLQRRKGQDTMIRALPMIREHVPDVLYAVVGEGDRREHLRELVVELGVENHVQFHGEPVDGELLRSYQQCDLFALPNRQIGGDIEGFGIVLLEAQACGKPVIAGASGGTAETMRRGESGITIDCSEPTELAKRVVELLLDERRRTEMGRAARQWVVSRFDWEPLTSEARELFRQVAETNDVRHGAVAPSDV